jgi:hypothetical protein
LASRLIREVMSYCFDGKLYGSDRVVDDAGLRLAMRRFVSVAWLLHSEMLLSPDGTPMTLEQLSKLPQLDCTRCSLSLLAQKFGKKWDFHARVQKRKGGKPAYAASAKTGWEKRRAREEAEVRKAIAPQLGDS